MGSRSLGLVAGASLAAVILMITLPTHAVIERPYPLRAAVDDADTIIVAKVERVDVARRAAVLVTTETLKGQSAPARVPLLLTGESAQQSNQALERLAPERPVVVFITDTGEKSLALFFSEGTWFQATGKTDGDVLRLSFTHMEPYLRRTFKGTTEELRQALVGGIAGKAELPAVDPTVAPGIGETLVKIDTQPTEPATTPPVTTDPPKATVTTPASNADGMYVTRIVAVVVIVVSIAAMFIVMAKRKRWTG